MTNSSKVRSLWKPDFKAEMYQAKTWNFVKVWTLFQPDDICVKLQNDKSHMER